MSIDMSVSKIMTSSVITISPDTQISQIARLLWENDLSSLPVVEGGEVVGMVTDYDLISRQTEYESPIYIPFIDLYFRLPGSGDEDQLRRILATSARELMSFPVQTVSADDDLQDVATVLYENRINAVPVIDHYNKLIGIVSRADIVGLMAQESILHARESEE